MKRLLFSCLLLAFCSTTFAKNNPNYGVSLHTPIISTEPDDVYGIQIMGTYDPDRFQWRKFNIYFDAGISYFKATSATKNKHLWIASVAPVVRYLFNQQRFARPFLELSVGLAYLNRTRFDSRNLGIHFAFQDRVGFGALFGKKNQWAASITAVHYSNAHLSEHNSGTTIPVMFNLAYRFL